MKRIRGERLKPVTAALLLAAAVLFPAAGVRADGQTGSQSHAQGAQSDDDAALMEFLGGIGSEDDEWIDYLARNDPTKIPPKKARPDGPKPSDPPQASAASSSGSEKK